MKKFIVSIIAATSILSISAPLIATTPTLPSEVAGETLGEPFNVLNVNAPKNESGLPYISLTNSMYKKDFTGILMAGKGSLPGGISMMIDANSRKLVTPGSTEGNLDLKDIKAGEIVNLKIQFQDGYYIDKGVGPTNINIAIAKNPATGKDIEILVPGGTVTFTDAKPLGELKNIILKFKMPETDVDILKDFIFYFSTGELVLPTPVVEPEAVEGSGFLLNLTPGKNANALPTLTIKSDKFKDSIPNLITSSKNTMPSSMTAQIKLGNGEPVSQTSAIPAGTEVSLILKMYESYALKGGAGQQTLEVTASSPKFTITPAINSQVFTDDKPIGSVQNLTFKFKMPAGNVDLLNDIKFDFKLK